MIVRFQTHQRDLPIAGVGNTLLGIAALSRALAAVHDGKAPDVIQDMQRPLRPFARQFGTSAKSILRRRWAPPSRQLLSWGHPVNAVMVAHLVGYTTTDPPVVLSELSIGSLEARIEGILDRLRRALAQILQASTIVARSTSELERDAAPKMLRDVTAVVVSELSPEGGGDQEAGRVLINVSTGMLVNGLQEIQAIECSLADEENAMAVPF
jgi:hypothetical protein